MRHKLDVLLVNYSEGVFNCLWIKLSINQTFPVYCWCGAGANSLMLHVAILLEVINYVFIFFFLNKKERYIFSGTLWVIPINFYVSKQNLNWSSGNIYLLAYKSLQEKPTLGWKCRWSTTVYRLSGLPSRPDYLTRMWKFKTINTWCNSVLCSMPTGKVIFQWI